MRVILLIVSFGLARMAFPGITQYTNRAAWTSAVGGAAIIEDFEDESLGNLALPGTFLVTGFGVDVAVGQMAAEVEAGNQGYGFSVSGSQWLGLQSTTTRDYTTELSLPFQTTGYGFDITGFQDFDRRGGIDLALYQGIIQVDSAFLSLPGTFGPDFRGVTSTASFDRVRLTFQNLEWVGLDDLSAPVPEPATFVGVGLASVLVLRRRHKLR